MHSADDKKCTIPAGSRAGCDINGLYFFATMSNFSKIPNIRITLCLTLIPIIFYRVLLVGLLPKNFIIKGFDEKQAVSPTRDLKQSLHFSAEFYLVGQLYFVERIS
jgi:hypothetical protein